MKVDTDSGSNCLMILQSNWSLSSGILRVARLERISCEPLQRARIASLKPDDEIGPLFSHQVIGRSMHYNRLPKNDIARSA